MIVDTSGLLAFFNSGEPAHEAAVAAVASATSPLVVSPFVIAELDYLLLTRLGVDAELLVLAELSGGAWHLVHDRPGSSSAVSKRSSPDTGTRGSGWPMPPWSS